MLDRCNNTMSQAAMEVAAHWEMQDSQKVCPQGSTSLFRTSATVPCLHAIGSNVTTRLMQLIDAYTFTCITFLCYYNTHPVHAHIQLKQYLPISCNVGHHEHILCTCPHG